MQPLLLLPSPPLLLLVLRVVLVVANKNVKTKTILALRWLALYKYT